jgi:TPR repeat protein
LKSRHVSQTFPLGSVDSFANGRLAWGDVDALAEAGFCYAQGIGCKKDLKKSAKFYREAEAKGMSMVGNSW